MRRWLKFTWNDKGMNEKEIGREKILVCFHGSFACEGDFYMNFSLCEHVFVCELYMLSNIEIVKWENNELVFSLVIYAIKMLMQYLFEWLKNEITNEQLAQYKIPYNGWSANESMLMWMNCFFISI